MKEADPDPASPRQETTSGRTKEVDESGQEVGHLQPHERGARPIARPLRMWAGSCGVSAHVETPPRRMIFAADPTHLPMRCAWD